MGHGFISLHRKILEWEWYSDQNTFRIFIHLLLKANHKDNKYKGFMIKRGQLTTSLTSLETELKIGKQSIRTSLNRLKKTSEINTQTNTRFTLITICNYESYQQPLNETNTRTNKQLTHDQHTTNTHNNNVNNVNNVNKSNSGEKMKRTKKKIISSGNSKPAIKERNKTFLPIAERLSKIISSDKNITHSKQQLTGWTNDIRILSEMNKISTKRMKIVLRWYKTNIGAQYTPVIESGHSFRHKFINLEAAIQRGKNGHNKPNNRTKMLEPSDGKYKNQSKVISAKTYR